MTFEFNRHKIRELVRRHEHCISFSSRLETNKYLLRKQILNGRFSSHSSEFFFFTYRFFFLHYWPLLPATIYDNYNDIMSHRVSPFFPPRLRRDNTKTPKCNATVTHNQPNNENEDDPAQHTLHRLNSGIVDRIFLLLLFCSKSHLSPGDFDFFFNV